MSEIKPKKKRRMNNIFKTELKKSRINNMSEIKLGQNKFKQPNHRIITIYGPMCAGKTEEIIKMVREFKKEGLNYVCLKPNIDNRVLNGKSTEQRIVSRGTKFTVPAIGIETNLSEQEIKNLVDKYDILIFDESQFFPKDLIEKFVKFFNQKLSQDYSESKSMKSLVKYYSEKKSIKSYIKLCCKRKSIKSYIKSYCYESLKYRKIILAGLDMDFTGKEFETFTYAKSISDKQIRLTAMCSAENCLEKATHSTKIAGSKDKQVEVGGDDMYKPMCEKHWREFSGF